MYPDKEESDHEEKMTKKDALEMQDRFDNLMRVKQEEIEKLKDQLGGLKIEHEKRQKQIDEH